MNKFILTLVLISSIGLYTEYNYHGSTTASVILAGSVIKASHIESNKKYPRKDCPVCKGKGWYISGDGIAKVNCGYCEPPKTQDHAEKPQKTIISRK